MMKRIKSKYHALQVLSSAQPKLRKAIISNSNRELMNCISESILNVLKSVRMRQTKFTKE
jgi:predicted nucleotidyltransferase